MRRTLIALTLLAAFAGPFAWAATDGTPKGWFMAGNKPENYHSGVDADGTAFLASKSDAATEGFGTMMQSIKADNYAGKRVRLRASVRSENVQGWAGLWMRVDKGTAAFSIDNMASRPIKGTTAWNTYDVVLDVPADATGIAFGTLMESSGEVWLNHVSLEVVGTDVKPTNIPYGGQEAPSAPVNLDFRQ